MSKLSKTLKAITILLSLLLTAGSTLIAYDAQRLASSGVEFIPPPPGERIGDYVVFNVSIRIKNTGYFFDIYDVNITILVIDEEGNRHAKDSKVHPELKLGESALLTLTLKIPATVIDEWNAGNIELYWKLIFKFWFGKYGYKLIMFGIAGKGSLRGE